MASAGACLQCPRAGGLGESVLLGACCRGCSNRLVGLEGNSKAISECWLPTADATRHSSVSSAPLVPWGGGKARARGPSEPCSQFCGGQRGSQEEKDNRTQMGQDGHRNATLVTDGPAREPATVNSPLTSYSSLPENTRKQLRGEWLLSVPRPSGWGHQTPRG